MTAKSIAVRSLALLAWFVFLYCGWLIVQSSIGYFYAYDGMPFVEEKLPISERPLWRWALIFHAGAGLVCFAASILQFFRGLTRRWPALHRWLGRIYAWAVLAVLCPTGFYLAIHAKGGLPGQIALTLLGLLTVYTTGRGVIEMRARRTRPHMRWMIRSFAMITSAITYRTLNASLGQFTFDYELGYLASVWLSILGNATLAEWLIRKFVPLTATAKPNHENPIHNPELDPVRLA